MPRSFQAQGWEPRDGSRFRGSKNTVFDANVYFGNVKAVKDAHGMTADPKLSEPGTAGLGLNAPSGYGLRPDSPAINSGRRIEASGGRDFFGNPVPSCGGVDRGDIESVNCAKK